MRARLKGLHSPDIENLEEWVPDEEQFGFFLQAMVGPSEAEGEESFGIMVCTPQWFAANKLAGGIAMPLHTILVAKYDYRALKTFIECAVGRTEGNAWADIAAQLSWLGDWEFSNYDD